MMSRSSIYKMILAGEFNRPVRVGTMAVGWRASDIAAWMESRPVTRGEFDPSNGTQASPSQLGH